jgi:hypothetical protein
MAQELIKTPFGTSYNCVEAAPSPGEHQSVGFTLLTPISSPVMDWKFGGGRGRVEREGECKMIPSMTLI